MEHKFDSSFGTAMNSRVGQSSNSLSCEREFTHPKRPTYVPKLWDEWDCENGPVFHAHPRNGSDKNEIENMAPISLGVLECPLDIETDGQREKPSFVPCLWSNWETQIENENSNNSLYQGTNKEDIANPTITPKSESTSLTHLIESLFLASARSMSEENYNGCPLSSDVFGEWIEEILDNPDNMLEVHLEARKVVEAIYDSKETAPETPKSANSDELQGHNELSDEFLEQHEFKISSPCNDSVDSERVVDQVTAETESVQPREHDTRFCKTPSPRCSTISLSPKSDLSERSTSEGPASERSTSPRSASARSTPRSSVRSTIESYSDAVKSARSSEHISVYSTDILTSNRVEKKDRLAGHYAEIAKREALLGIKSSAPERSTSDRSTSKKSSPRSTAQSTIKSDSDGRKSTLDDKTADVASSECTSISSDDTLTSNTGVNKDRLAGHYAEIAKREALLGIDRLTPERSTSAKSPSESSTLRLSGRRTIESDSNDQKSALNDKTASVASSECTSLSGNDALSSHTDVKKDRLAGHYVEIAKREQLLERLRSGEIMATPIYINGQRWRLAEHYVEMNRRLSKESQQVKSIHTDCINTSNAMESEADNVWQQRLQQHYDAMNRNAMNRDAMNRDDAINPDAMNSDPKMRRDSDTNRGTEQDRCDQTNMHPNMRHNISIRVLEDKQTHKAVTFSEDAVEEPFIPLSPHSTLAVSSFKNSDSDLVLTSVNRWANSALNHRQYRDNINENDAPGVGTDIDKTVLGSSKGQGDSCDFFHHDLVTVSSNNDQSQSVIQNASAKSGLNHHLKRFLTCLPEVDLSKLNIPVAGPISTANDMKNMKKLDNNMKLSLNSISTEKLNRARRTLRRYKRMK